MSEQLLSPEQRLQLELLAGADIPAAQVRRARLLLFLDQGVATSQAAQAVGFSAGRARHWRSAFRSQGMQIFPAGTLQLTALSPDGGQPTAVEAAPESAPLLIEPPAPPKPEPKLTPLEKFLAKAPKLKKPGIIPDDPLAEAGRKVLRYHFAQMLLHEEGTRLGEDIEELHDMRVATRRMRAAFEVFGDAFTPKTIKTHLKGLKGTGRTLGKVRDLDVFMEKAQAYLETLPPERGAELGPLLESWRGERETARTKMLVYLDGERYAAFKDDFHKFVTTRGAGARGATPLVFTPSQARDIAPVLIYGRLASVRAFDSMLETASLEQLHALRIEFKKLRYTVEFFREVLGAETKAVINDLKVVQDHLGDLNDADVAIKILRDFLSAWDDQEAALPVVQRQSPEPILAYLAYRYNERQMLMQTFGDTWAYFNRPDFLQNLALAVSAL